ncbi:MAG TPA: DUF1415 domain-containing protein [Gemmata sp.]
MDPKPIIEATRHWIANVVIGLNLCPFARRVFDGGLIRYTVTDAVDATTLTAALTEQLLLLSKTPAADVETAFLIHPNALGDFLDYNDFIAESELLVAELRLEGVVQIAGFHPQYRFAGTRPDDIANYTNRSPFPMLHLLREDSITKVNGDPEKLLDIPARNIETLRKLGEPGLLALLKRDPA